MGTNHLTKLVESYRLATSNRRLSGKSSFTTGSRREPTRAPPASAHGGRSQAQNSFFAIADGGPISARITASSGSGDL